MKPEELDALEALLAKGTARPWREAWTNPELETRMSNKEVWDEVLIAGPGDPHFGPGGDAVMGTLWHDGDHVAGVAANCALIVGAVNALPKLIEEIRKLRAVADLVPALSEYLHTPGEECIVEEMERRLAAVAQ